MSKPKVIILLFIVFLENNYSQIINGSFETSSGEYSINGWENYGGVFSNDTPPGGGKWSISFWAGDIISGASQTISYAKNNEVWKVTCWVKKMTPASYAAIGWYNGNKFKIHYINEKDTLWRNAEFVDTLQIEGANTISIKIQGWGGMKASGGAKFDLITINRIDSLSTRINEFNNELPTEFSLGQNYPNPFNPTTNIIFSISQTSHVTLKVFDLLGRNVATLVNEERTPGNYKIEFDGNKLSSGIYYYRLHADNFSQTKKFILMK